MIILVALGWEFVLGHVEATRVDIGRRKTVIAPWRDNDAGSACRMDESAVTQIQAYMRYSVCLAEENQVAADPFVRFLHRYETRVAALYVRIAPENNTDLPVTELDKT